MLPATFNPIIKAKMKAAVCGFMSREAAKGTKWTDRTAVVYPQAK